MLHANGPESGFWLPPTTKTLKEGKSVASLLGKVFPGSDSAWRTCLQALDAFPDVSVEGKQGRSSPGGRPPERLQEAGAPRLWKRAQRHWTRLHLDTRRSEDTDPSPAQSPLVLLVQDQ